MHTWQIVINDRRVHDIGYILTPLVATTLTIIDNDAEITNVYVNICME